MTFVMRACRCNREDVANESHGVRLAHSLHTGLIVRQAHAAVASRRRNRRLAATSISVSLVCTVHSSSLASRRLRLSLAQLR